MTYYCIGCGRSHEKENQHVIFRTAYHYQPSGEKLHVGFCPKHRQQQSVEPQKQAG